MTGLALTGERTLPGIADENYWFRRHEAAYLAVLPFTVGARVLEAGAGEGYGAELLRHRAGGVVALDYDATVTSHIAARYPGVAVLRGDLQRLPVGDARVDCVVSLQVIEHLHDQPGFLAECARVLRPAGTLVVSTPNRLTFSPGGAAPVNPFHTRELSAEELAGLLEPHFSVSRMWGVAHGPRLRRLERRHGPLVSAQLSTPPAAWSAALRRVVHAVTSRDFTVGPARLDSCLDLVAVCWRRP